jgi:hypothetical protein
MPIVLVDYKANIGLNSINSIEFRDFWKNFRKSGRNRLKKALLKKRMERMRVGAKANRMGTKTQRANGNLASPRIFAVKNFPRRVLADQRYGLPK